jgi:hypothetical protein
MNRSPAKFSTTPRTTESDRSINSSGPSLSNGVPALPSVPEATRSVPSLNSVPASSPQPTWPPATTPATGSGAAKTLEPAPVQTPTDSSYQTKYPPALPNAPVPVMPKPGTTNPDDK